MNSNFIYTQLIERRRSNPLPRGPGTEVHHIVPRSHGGSNDPDNLIRLTLREHYVAHHLLYKIHRDRPMAMAWLMMSSARGLKITSRQYEAAKKAVSEQGFSDEHKDKLSEAQKKRWDDPAERAKTSEGQKKRYEDPAERAKLSEAQKKRCEDPEYRAKLSEANKKRYEDPAERAKTSEALKKRYEEDPEYRAKLSEAAKNQPKTACPHCNKEFIGTHMKRYHGDKCKLKPSIV